MPKLDPMGFGQFSTFPTPFKNCYLSKTNVCARDRAILGVGFCANLAGALWRIASSTEEQDSSGLFHICVPQLRFQLCLKWRAICCQIVKLLLRTFVTHMRSVEAINFQNLWRLPGVASQLANSLTPVQHFTVDGSSSNSCAEADFVLGENFQLHTHLLLISSTSVSHWKVHTYTTIWFQNIQNNCNGVQHASKIK